MELLVATWSIRVAIVAAAVVGAISVSAGSTVIDAIDRGVIVAFVFTLAGRWLIGFLETPEQRVARLRARRQQASAKSAAKSSAKPETSRGAA